METLTLKLYALHRLTIKPNVSHIYRSNSGLCQVGFEEPQSVHLNMTDGLFHMTFYGFMCHRNVRRKVICPLFTRLRENHLAKTMKRKKAAAVCLPAWRGARHSCCSLMLVNLHLYKHLSWMSSLWCWIYHFKTAQNYWIWIYKLWMNSFLDIFFKKVLFFWPDGDDLTRVEMDTIHLGNEDGCHSLIQSSSVHVDGGSHREHKTGDSLVNPQVLLQAPEGNGKCTSTG